MWCMWKVKQSLLRPSGLQKVEDPSTSRQSAQKEHPPSPKEIPPVLISVRGWVDNTVHIPFINSKDSGLQKSSWEITATLERRTQYRLGRGKTSFQVRASVFRISLYLQCRLLFGSRVKNRVTIMSLSHQHEQEVRELYDNTALCIDQQSFLASRKALGVDC